MGSWSTSAPSLPPGSSWSAEQNTGTTLNDQYYKGRSTCAVARGPGNTIYVRFKVQSYLKIQGQGARSYTMGVQVTINGKSESRGSIDTHGEHYGYYAQMATWYYTGNADAGVTIECRSYQGSNMSTATYFTAPALVTFVVTYNANGGTGGLTPDQTKVYGVDLILNNNDFTRNGWAFDWWNTAADGSGTSYAEGASYTDNAALTLYAIWHQTDIPVFVNDNGRIIRIAKAYANVGGSIKECDVYVNVGGDIKLLI